MSYQQPWPPPQEPHSGQWTGQHQQPHTGPHYPPQQPPPKRDDTMVYLIAAGIVAVVLIIVFAVIARDGDSTTTAGDTAPDSSVAETATLVAIRAEYPKYKDVPDEVVLDLGREVCTSLRAGTPYATVGVVLADGAHIGLEEAGFVMGASIPGLCPDQRHHIPR